MTEETKDLLQALEAAKNRALDYLRGLTVSQIQQSPAGEWSMVQVIEHILFSETGTLGYMVKKTSSGFEELADVTDAERFAGNALVRRLKSDERYKAPAVLPDPEGNSNFEELETKWSALRVKLNEFVEAFPDTFLNKLVFKQPAAGMITLHDTLRFLTHHIEHHYAQLERLKAQVK